MTCPTSRMTTTITRHHRFRLTMASLAALTILVGACGSSDAAKAAEQFVGFLNSRDFASAAALTCKLPGETLDPDYVSQNVVGAHPGPFKIIKESSIADGFVKVEISHGDGTDQLLPFKREPDGKWRFCPITALN